MGSINRLIIELEGSKSVQFVRMVIDRGGQKRELPKNKISWSTGAQTLILFLIRYASGGSRFLDGELARPLYQVFRLRQREERFLYWSREFFELFGREEDGGSILSRLLHPSKPEGVYRVEIVEELLPARNILVFCNKEPVVTSEQYSQVCSRLEGRAISNRNSFFTQTNYDQFDAWLLFIEQESQAISSPEERRRFLLRMARRYFNTDYITWGVGKYDWKAKGCILFDFLDDADDAEQFYEDEAVTKQRNKSAYLRYVRVTHIMNSDSAGGGVLAYLAGEFEEELIHVTLERAKLMKDMHLSTKLKMLTKTGRLAQYRMSGLRDYMFSIRRHAGGVLTGTGFHRTKGKSPFDVVERDYIHQFNIHFQSLLHTTTVDCNSISVGKFSVSERFAFVLLVSKLPDRDIMAMAYPKLSPIQLTNTLETICAKLQIPVSRTALRNKLGFFEY